MKPATLAALGLAALLVPWTIAGAEPPAETRPVWDPTPVPAPPPDLDVYVQETGDTMTGDLAMQGADILFTNDNGVDFPGGLLKGNTALSYGGVTVSLAGHTHDDRYYTETESDARFLRRDTSGTLDGNLTVTGRLGIGTAAPSTELHVIGEPLLQLPNDTTSGGILFGNNRWSIAAYGNAQFEINEDTAPIDTTVVRRFLIQADTGNVGIGTMAPNAKLAVVGDIKASGPISANTDVPTGDVVEPAVGEGLEAGDVVISAGFTAGGKLMLKKADAPHLRQVVGVVSTNPSLRLAGAASDIPLAVTGIVPVKVIGSVAEGDLLTTSSTPGHAMTCNVPGTCFGYVLGKALESHPGAEPGTVRVLIGLS